jgi:hypothetical protein
MKKILLFLLCVFCFCTSEKDSQSNICDNNFIKKNFPNAMGNMYEQRIYFIEIDSCEYVFIPDHYGTSVSHKGNCKFCKIRNERNK